MSDDRCTFDICTTCEKRIEQINGKWVHIDGTYQARSKHVARPRVDYEARLFGIENPATENPATGELKA